MSICAAATGSGVWFNPYRSDSTSAFRTSTLHPIEKAGGVSVRIVATKVETQNSNETDALASTFEDAICCGRKNPKRLSSSASQVIKADHFPVIRYPLRTESAIKAMSECNTLVFAVSKHANKKNIKEHVMKIFKVRVEKVNTVIMPDGTKKAYIMLPPQFKASDVAKKIGIF